MPSPGHKILLYGEDWKPENTSRGHADRPPPAAWTASPVPLVGPSPTWHHRPEKGSQRQTEGLYSKAATVGKYIMFALVWAVMGNRIHFFFIRKFAPIWIGIRAFSHSYIINFKKMFKYIINWKTSLKNIQKYWHIKKVLNYDGEFLSVCLAFFSLILRVWIRIQKVAEYRYSLDSDPQHWVWDVVTWMCQERPQQSL